MLRYCTRCGAQTSSEAARSSGAEAAETSTAEASPNEASTDQASTDQATAVDVSTVRANNGQGSTNLGCFEHAIQPYFTPQDLSDWQMVTITSSDCHAYSAACLTIAGRARSRKARRALEA